MPALRPGGARSERVLPAARASTLTLCSLYATLPDPLLTGKPNESATGRAENRRIEILIDG